MTDIVVSFEGYVPMPRFDGLPWTTLRIEESASSAGPWTVIDTQTLDPIDDNPEEPLSRDFTTDEATIIQGWYRVTFFDAAGQSMAPTHPVQNIPEETEPYLPLVKDIAAMLRARTKDKYGNELGTFDENTRPTGQDVIDLIQQAANDVTTLIDTDIPQSGYRFAQAAISYLTCMLIEMSYYPEQVPSGRSPWHEFKELYDAAMANLLAAIERERGEAETGESGLSAGMARFTFPPEEVLVGWKTPM